MIRYTNKLNKFKNILILILINCLLLVVLASCQKNNVNENETQDESVTQESESTFAYPITLTDQSGRVITFSEPATKIVSTSYAATNCMIALGLKHKITGVEEMADTNNIYKLAAPELVALDKIADDESVDTRKVKKLAPDLVVMPYEHKQYAKEFEVSGIQVLVINPNSHQSLKESISLIGKATGTVERAEMLISYCDKKMNQITNLTTGMANRIKVYFASQTSYFTTCTSSMYQQELIDLAGGVNVSASLEMPDWTPIEADQLLEWNPDFILISHNAEYDIEDIKGNEKLSGINAVKNNKIYVFPSKLENWDDPVPSSVLGLLWLTSILHPELYNSNSYIRDAQEFYNTFYDIDVTREDIGL